MKIKQGKALAARIGDEFGVEDDLAQLLQPICPTPEQTPAGTHYFAPDEVQLLDRMFERFGLTLRSSDDKFDDVEYVRRLWYRLCQNLGSHIECSWHSPKLHALELKDMPADWQTYINAVVQGDRVEDQRLAAALDVENVDAFCVRGLFGD